MTYLPSELKTPVRLEVAFFSWVGSSQTIGDSFAPTLLSHTWESAPLISGTDIVLPAGQYMAQAFVSATRSIANANARYSFAVNGVLTGEYGQTDMYENFQCDTADATFSVVDGATASLSLRLINIETSLPVITDNSRIVLWRSANVEL